LGFEFGLGFEPDPDPPVPLVPQTFGQGVKSPVEQKQAARQVEQPWQPLSGEHTPGDGPASGMPPVPALAEEHPRQTSPPASRIRCAEFIYSDARVR